MLNKTQKLRSLTRLAPLTLAILSILQASTLKAQDMPTPPPGFPEGMMPGDEGLIWAPSGHDKAAIYIKNGLRKKSKEYKDGRVSITTAPGASGIGTTTLDGLFISSNDYTATGIVINDGNYQVGGDKDYYTVYSNINNDYLGTSLTSGKNNLGRYNSVLLFSLNENVTADTTTGSSGIDADNNALVHLDNVYMQVDGAQRYVDSTFADAKKIINDSYLVSTGDATRFTDDITLPFSNAALLIDGAARTNFSINNSDTYYFNSTVIAEGWAALSTDACSDLNLYAYNTTAKAINGGYATYADFNCHVQLFGSDLEAAEIGAIISKSGLLTVLDGQSASSDILVYNKGDTTTAGSVIRGGRNAIMIHAPDMRGEGLPAVDYGYITVKNSTLTTSKQLVTTFDYQQYGDAIQSYVDYTSGDLILVKSTSGDIKLENATLNSYNGVLVRTILNSDRMGNFIAAGDNEKRTAEGELIVKPLSISLKDMSTQGDILHQDYQRNMELTLASASLIGQISQTSHSEWQQFWQSKGIEKAYFLPNKTWQGTNSLSVSLDSQSSWQVTDASSLSQLSLAKGSSISAQSGYQLVMTIDGKRTAIKPGAYHGDIVLTPIKKS